MGRRRCFGTDVAGVAHYVDRLGLPAVVWDKDRKLPADDRLRHTPNVTICEPALHPSPGAASVMFPVADQVLDAADPVALSQLGARSLRRCGPDDAADL
jgi:hypothetical protein